MRETGRRPRHHMAARAFGSQEAVVRDLPEHDDDAEPGEEIELTQEIAATGHDLLRGQAVGGRRAAGHRGDEGVPQPEPVVTVDR